MQVEQKYVYYVTSVFSLILNTCFKNSVVKIDKEMYTYAFYLQEIKKSVAVFYF